MHVKSYRSPKAEVKESKISGRGLFAISLIKKDEIIAIKGGYIVNTETLNANQNIVNHSELQLTDDLYLANMVKEEFDDVMGFFNHSCEPNAGFMGNIVSVAMRDIKPGEEIVEDYACWQNSDNKFECICGSKNCRKIITGKDWQIKELQQKYGKYFAAYLKEKFIKP